jgi:hypothetical protein
MAMNILAFLQHAALTGIAYAQSRPPTFSLGTTPGSQASAVQGYACGIAGWVFTAAIIISIIIAILTGIQYMTAGGNPEKLKSAHHKLLYIAVGLAIALLARAMPTMINGVLQGQGGSGLDVCAGKY